jgi:hypothetical protein
MKYLVEELARNKQRFSGYGYDLYVQKAWDAYVVEVEKSQPGTQRGIDISSVFLDAAWELCRRGIVRPGIRAHFEHVTADGSAGYGYSLTPYGGTWLDDPGHKLFIPTEPERFGEMLGGYKSKFGAGFHQRAQEAVRCYEAGAYLGCAAMCGASAESILLALAMQKKTEEEVLKLYLAASGRKKIEDLIVGRAATQIQSEFRGLTSLLKYWRDAASPGTSVILSSNEAYTSLTELYRFAVYSSDHWAELTT